jgi:hypothetical protein
LGTRANGTHVDLHFSLDDADYLLTIKRQSQLGDQTVKILLGELVVILSSLVHNKHPRRVNLVFVNMSDRTEPKKPKDERALMTLFRGIEFLKDSLGQFSHNIRLYVADAGQEKTAVIGPLNRL